MTSDRKARPRDPRTGPPPQPGPPAAEFAPPIAVLAGTSDRETGIDAATADRVRTALEGFRGTIISGGTATGVGGLAGDIAEASGADAAAIGYLPATAGERDPRYVRFVETPGRDFSLLEPITYWRDILAAGIDPASVTVLVIGGGAIAEAEARLALALGARVVAFADSGRAADRLLADPTWSQCPTLRAAPDTMNELRDLVLPSPA